MMCNFFAIDIDSGSVVNTAKVEANLIILFPGNGNVELTLVPCPTTKISDVPENIEPFLLASRQQPLRNKFKCYDCASKGKYGTSVGIGLGVISPSNPY